MPLRGHVRELTLQMAARLSRPRPSRQAILRFAPAISSLVLLPPDRFHSDLCPPSRAFRLRVPPPRSRRRLGLRRNQADVPDDRPSSGADGPRTIDDRSRVPRRTRCRPCSRDTAACAPFPSTCHGDEHPNPLHASEAAGPCRFWVSSPSCSLRSSASKDVGASWQSVGGALPCIPHGRCDRGRQLGTRGARRGLAGRRSDASVDNSALTDERQARGKRKVTALVLDRNSSGVKVRCTVSLYTSPEAQTIPSSCAARRCRVRCRRTMPRSRRPAQELPDP